METDELELERTFGRIDSAIGAAWSAICNQTEYQRLAKSVWDDSIPPQLVSCLSDLERTSSHHAWMAFARAAAIVYAHRDQPDWTTPYAYASIVEQYRQVHEHAHPWEDFDQQELERRAYQLMIR